MKIGFSHQGFTLLETLITIIIASVLGVIVAQAVSGQTWRSYAPLQTMAQNLALRAAMDIVVDDYRNLIRYENDPSALVTLANRIESGSYWDGKPFLPPDVQILAENAFIYFEKTGGPESDTGSGHSIGALRVILSIQGTERSLVSLFAQ